MGAKFVRRYLRTGSGRVGRQTGEGRVGAEMITSAKALLKPTGLLRDFLAHAAGEAWGARGGGAAAQSRVTHLVLACVLVAVGVVRKGAQEPDGGHGPQAPHAEAQRQPHDEHPAHRAPVLRKKAVIAEEGGREEGGKEKGMGERKRKG